MSVFLFFSFILNCFTNSFNNKPESSRDSTILIMSSISSLLVWLYFHQRILRLSYVFLHLLMILLQLILMELKHFFINGNPVFRNGLRNLRRNSPNCAILDKWAFDNLISVDELFAKALLRFVTCLLVNNNLWGKLVSSSKLSTIFDYNLKTTSVLFFNEDFNFLSCEFDSFTFKLLCRFMQIKIKSFDRSF